MKHFCLVLCLVGAAATLGGQDPARFDVMEQSIESLQDAMQKGTVTSRQLVDLYLARIDAYDRRGPRLNAMVSINPRAREDADALDRERRERGPRGPLHGIPIVIKDNFDMAGLPTTAGTIAFTELRPKADAAQVKKLRDAGAVILGKTNLHELASGITTIGTASGQTRNPYDLSRNPGGSSGGTGAAVAANFAAAGMGTDTCGSIRIPASHNALVGLRSTHGLTSLAGIVPLSHSQDVGGPLGRTVADVAILLDATVGVSRYRAALVAGALEGARLGVLTSMFGTASEDNEAGAIVRRAVEQMKKRGAVVTEVVVPGLEELLSGSSVIDTEFKFDLAEYLAGIPDAPVKSLAEILDKGLYHSAIENAMRRRNAVDKPDSEQYRRARIKRESVRRAVMAAFEEHRFDALVYPTMRRKPALIGEAQAGSTCQLSAASGLPALSVPAGFTNDALPIGLELMGAPESEARLLALAYSFEQPEAVRRPPFSAPALVNGAAPAPLTFATTLQSSGTPIFRARFVFDRTTGELKYEAASLVLPTLAGHVRGAWLHRGAEGERGPAVFSVLGRDERSASGTIVIPPAEHARLLEGRYYLMFYTRSAPHGLRAQVTVR